MLLLVEENIEQHFRLILVFGLEALIQLAELSAFGVFLDLAIPLAGMALAQMPHEFENLFARRFPNCRFDFLNLRHAYSLARTGPRSFGLGQSPSHAIALFSRAGETRCPALVATLLCWSSIRPLYGIEMPI